MKPPYLFGTPSAVATKATAMPIVTAIKIILPIART
jgi:hypothetical protein